ncbi:MAG: C-GCAxxG-C-C family (seleno)protein [Nitrospirota bacterium]
MFLTKKEMSRRGFLTLVGKLGVGAALGGSILNLGSKALGATVPLPWVTWPSLDPDEIAEKAYWGYYGKDTDGTAGIDGKSCAYAVFNAIVSELNPEAAYKLPEEMMQYGHGGVSGMGHICGALNGASAVINLIKGATPIKKNLTLMDNTIKQLMLWYEQEEHPTYVPPFTPKLDFTPPTIVPHSALCHVFVTKWCHEYGYTTSSPQRGECCARLAADVAKRTVELLNGTVTETYDLTDSTQRCLSCHGSSAMDNVKGQMECLTCHKKHHGSGK